MRNCGFLYCSLVWFALHATHYELLNIPHTATQKEIRTAYLKSAKRMHPDKSIDENATRLFQEIANAYDVLKDPEARRDYDATLQRENTAIDSTRYACCNFNTTLFKQWAVFFFAPCISMPHTP